TARVTAMPAEPASSNGLRPARSTSAMALPTARRDQHHLLLRRGPEEKSPERRDAAQREDRGGACPRTRGHPRRAPRRRDAAGHVSVEASYRFVHGTLLLGRRVSVRSQKLMPASNPITKASGIRPVPAGLMMYWRSGAK